MVAVAGLSMAQAIHLRQSRSRPSPVRARTYVGILQTLAGFAVIVVGVAAGNVAYPSWVSFAGLRTGMSIVFLPMLGLPASRGPMRSVG